MLLPPPPDAAAYAHTRVTKTDCPLAMRLIAPMSSAHRQPHALRSAWSGARRPQRHRVRALCRCTHGSRQLPGPQCSRDRRTLPNTCHCRVRKIRRHVGSPSDKQPNATAATRTRAVRVEERFTNGGSRGGAPGWCGRQPCAARRRRAGGPPPWGRGPPRRPP